MTCYSGTFKVILFTQIKSPIELPGVFEPTKSLSDCIDAVYARLKEAQENGQNFLELLDKEYKEAVKGHKGGIYLPISCSIL